MAVNYPTSLDNGSSLPNPSANDETNSPSLASGQGVQNEAVIAVETKLGIGSSTPSGTNLLISTGTGSSAWTKAAPTGTIVGTSDSQTLTNKILTSPTINTPTIASPTITGTTTVGTLNATTVTIGSALSVSGTLTIPTGSIIPNDLLASTGSSWAWQSWSPTWTNLTVGNGTVTALYTQIGKVVFLQLTFVLGSTSIMSSHTSPLFSLPVTSDASAPYQSAQGACWFVHSGSPYLGQSQIYDSTDGTMYYYSIVSSTVQTASLTTTAPFTWANGDILEINMTYRAA